MESTEKKKKRIQLSDIVSYLFGTIFLVVGLATIISGDYLSGLILLFAFIITVKPIMSFLEDKFNFSMSGAAKIFVVFCFVMGAAIALPESSQIEENDKEIASAPSEPVSTQETTSSTGSISVTGVNYKCGSWSDEQYPLIRLFGESYVPLCPSNERVWSARVDKLAKLVLDLPSEGETYLLRAGETLDLGNGYCLETKQIDVPGQMVWFEFTKDGVYVDDEIIKCGNSSDSTWSVNLDDIQGVSNIVVFRIHVNKIAEGAVDNIVELDGLWLIDYENTKTLKIGDKFGEFTLKEITNGVDESNPGYLVFESDN